MGRASRWLKSLFGIKNSKEYSNSGDGKDKKRCRIGHSGRGSSGGLCHNPTPNMSPAESVWLRSCYNETKKEQSMHAITVAAATAAAADAAVAAAQAAVTVVRLTSHGRGAMFGGGQERWAAIKIQTVFRGYLARKALRALKGLVKIQALVRGYLVRKQAKATLYSMQALMRAQATIRSQKARGIINHDANRFDIRARKSMERFDHTRSEQTVSIHSRRLSASLDTAKFNIDESAKIGEVDTGRPKSRSCRTNASVSDFGDYLPCKTLSSPLTSRFPARLWIPDSRHFQETDWRLTGDECGFSTAQSTPFFRHCGDFPKYMANTQSFKAKSRAHSAPKQRPEPGPQKLLSRNEMTESRSSLSGVRKQRSCSRVQEAINFRNAVMEKLDRPSEFGRDPERNQLHKRW